jgi:hypothetical protein
MTPITVQLVIGAVLAVMAERAYNQYRRSGKSPIAYARQMWREWWVPK